MQLYLAGAAIPYTRNVSHTVGVSRESSFKYSTLIKVGPGSDDSDPCVPMPVHREHSTRSTMFLDLTIVYIKHG